MEQKVTFDYIVVGSGPAGAVLAEKLTADRKTSLLLLEAGDNNSEDRPVRDSLFAPPFILTDDFLPNYFWPGKGVPQKNVADHSYEWTGGRTLGGGSSINNEQYVRPTQANMQEWENSLGPEWSPAKETAQFTKLENFNGTSSNPQARGTKGRLDIRQTPANPTNMAKKLVAAMEEATGFSEILDYNDPNTPLGPFLRWQLYQMPNGVRESADTAFLASDVMTKEGLGVDGRKLRVFFKSTALRVLFNEERRAIGVEFLKEGKCIQAFANKKVIVSAGINSPQFLMLSGVGPGDLLNAAGIPVVVDNPNVGKHLTTHPVNTATFTTNPNDRALPADDPFALYTSGGFFPDPTPGSDPRHRGVQIIGQKGAGHVLNIVFFLLEPVSRGSVAIQNDDPLKIVLADAGFLDSPEDLASIKDIYRVYIKNIAAQLAKIDPEYKLVNPTLDIIDDDQKLEAYIKGNLSPTHHIQGTNRMAPDAQHGVVNARGEVYGVKDLIVADDSIAPFPSDGNTSAPAFFIGANIADMLLADDFKS
jgi:choline dehydrogenase